MTILASREDLLQLQFKLLWKPLGDRRINFENTFYFRTSVRFFIINDFYCNLWLNCI